MCPEQIAFPSSFTAGPATGTEERPAPKPSASLQALADQLVLQTYAPPAVLTNEAGDIFYVSGRTGKYLEPAAGKANWNIFVMAREGLRYELARGVPGRHYTRKKSVVLHGVKVGTNGGAQFVDVCVQPLDDAGPLQGLVMIVFTDVPAPLAAPGSGPEGEAVPPAFPGWRNWSRSFCACAARPRATHEEMQTSQEEFRSTNEELQSTNEETAIHQRGAHHVEGGNAIHERGVADGQRGVAGQGGRTFARERRHEEICSTARTSRHCFWTRDPQRAPVHAAGDENHSN
ncbi:MAG: hypothetical protein WDM80_09805 [Limisphaerales bacterium]